MAEFRYDLKLPGNPAGRKWGKTMTAFQRCCVVLAAFAFSTSAGAGGTVSLKELISSNQANIQKLAEGMTKDQVKDLMGATGAETRDGVVSNPWSAENFNGKDGAKHEVLFYITRKNPPFTPIRKSLMTPVVFKGNKVIGWGPAALQEAGGSMK